jgi:hypothetical protein
MLHNLRGNYSLNNLFIFKVQPQGSSIQAAFQVNRLGALNKLQPAGKFRK